ncbi:DUF2071 domain-containing protein [Salinirubellus salinus]|uniref:DUF2071 domain-containing protein n=1 Tax=Salinirubellus salinus TaxID=1364945 RepID=A0A9E7R4Z1_9EURY|nr:DUF2071 domain-containing protein [Salinirubellus salinus]UWM55889.1 DUF2071 domain-containing protein [Salinirubellus salinus]
MASTDAVGERRSGPTPLLEMTWEDLLFAHWSVDPAVVARRLPAGYEVDTFDDEAYLGVVPFVMRNVRPAFLPSLPGPFDRTFGELNLRTYVRGPDGTPGVYFFNLDADDLLSVGVARSLFRLPYYRAEMDVDPSGGSVTFRSERTHRNVPACRFEATYGPDGDPFTPEEATLPHFLTERYRFYTVDDGGRTYYGDIGHEPWTLVPATADIRRNDLFTANGFERPDGDPSLLYARRIDVTAGRVHRV